MNLSLVGCLRETDLSLDVNAHLTLALRLPRHSDSIKINVAVVRWACRPHFGLDFVLVSDKSQGPLRDHLLTYQQSRPFCELLHPLTSPAKTCSGLPRASFAQPWHRYV
jgi:hypothetical protein